MGKFVYRIKKIGKKVQFVLYPNNNHDETGYIGKSQNYNSFLECQKAMNHFRKFVNEKNVKALENMHTRIDDTGAVEYIENHKIIFKTRPYSQSKARQKGVESIYNKIDEYTTNNLG